MTSGIVETLLLLGLVAMARATVKRIRTRTPLAIHRTRQTADDDQRVERLVRTGWGAIASLRYADGRWPDDLSLPVALADRSCPEGHDSGTIIT